MKTSSAFIFSLVCAVLMPFATAASWIHKLGDSVNPRPGPFRIQTVAEEEGHLIGRATYRFNAHDFSVKIEGVQTPDGRFWPNAALGASNSTEVEWQNLKQSAIVGRPASFVFKSDEGNPALYFNLDGFQPLIGKVKYGRLVLQVNGFNTIFELSGLLPSKITVNNEREPEWEARILYGYGTDPLAKTPFYITGIANEDGHLRAIADYVDPKSKAETLIEGTLTPPTRYADKEYFWAGATLQVTNDPDGDWQTIGQAVTPGVSRNLTIPAQKKSSTELNFGIDAMRSLVAEFAYGRVLLRNGQAAVFDMKNLLPPQIRR